MASLHPLVGLMSRCSSGLIRLQWIDLAGIGPIIAYFQSCP